MKDNTLKPMTNRNKTCTHEGCHRPVRCSGLCNTHYIKRYVTTCCVEGCNNVANSKGQPCSTHLGYRKKYGVYERPMTSKERGLDFNFGRFVDVAEKVLSQEVFDKINELAKSSTPVFRMGKIQMNEYYDHVDPDLAYEAQCEDRELNEDNQCEYWYMNLKDRDFIERDSATMNDLPF